jgi:hypothetical protein
LSFMITESAIAPYFWKCFLNFSAHKQMGASVTAHISANAQCFCTQRRYENAELNKWISQESKATSRTKVSRQNWWETIESINNFLAWIPSFLVKSNVHIILN